MRHVIALGALLLAGCSSTHTFTVSVRNDALEPMTVWLTKDGPPAEQGWLSPEQIALSGMAKTTPIGVVIPAGKTADMSPIQGTLDSGTHAILRIYRGQTTFDMMLATSRGSANRTDMVLEPGANVIRIDKDGKAFKG